MYNWYVILTYLKMNSEKDNQNLIPASILVGAILIAGSIIYSANSLGGGFGSITNVKNDNTDGVVVSVKARADAPVEGKGKLEIVEFADFQCPFCQKFYNEAYKELKAKYIDTGKVKFVYRHFPLSFHVNAQVSAEAAECANRQGKFWEYHDVLFTKGKSDGAGLDKVNLKKYALDLGLDTTKFNQCLDNCETTDVVKKDLLEGQNIKVSGTPSFVIDGKLLVGAQPFSAFEQAIESALK